MISKLDHICVGCVIDSIKKLLDDEPLNYIYNILEILFNASKYEQIESITSFLNDVETLIQNNSETWKILAKIESVDIIHDKLMSDYHGLKRLSQNRMNEEECA